MVKQSPVWTGDGLEVEVLLGECEPDGITGLEVRAGGVPRGGEIATEGQRGRQVAVSLEMVGRADHVRGKVASLNYLGTLAEWTSDPLEVFPIYAPAPGRIKNRSFCSGDIVVERGPG